MTVSELIQQQRHILHALHDTVRQYQKQIAQAQERLERTLEQIQADKAAAEQEAKREYEQARDKYITAALDAELPMRGVKEEIRASREQARAKLRTQLLSAASEKQGALSDIYDTNTIVEHIRKINPQIAIARAKRNVKKSPFAVISLVGIIGSCVSFFFWVNSSSPSDQVGALMVAVFLVSLVVMSVSDKRYDKRLSQSKEKAHEEEIAYLSALYGRWLELVANQTRSRNAEAQQAHQQSLEQAKQRFSNSLQQLRPTVLDYTTLTDQTPSWQSEAWQNWRPGMLTPGVVRLGVFTLQLDQLAVKSATISQSKHLAPGTVLGGKIIDPGTAKIPGKEKE